MSNARSNRMMRTCPKSVFRAFSTARFDRRNGFLTSCKSAICKSMRSPMVLALPLPFRDGLPPRSINRSVSTTHSSANDLTRKVREAYLPFRRTNARQLPSFVLTMVPMISSVQFIRSVQNPYTQGSKHIQIRAIVSISVQFCFPFNPLNNSINS